MNPPHDLQGRPLGEYRVDFIVERLVMVAISTPRL
jgi:hypothetical protein